MRSYDLIVYIALSQLNALILGNISTNFSALFVTSEKLKEYSYNILSIFGH